MLLRFIPLLGVLVVGCAGEAPEPPSNGFAAEALDRHRLLEDSELEGDQLVTAAQIQKLLEDEGSALAGFVEDGRSAAQWIVGESIAQGISPVYMVARIETESGLVRSGTLDYVLSATGCGCPDGQACDPSVAELGLQVRCAAELARSYLADIDATNETISGWGVGFGKYSLEGCWVEPQTRATAALYTYTPWVGAYATCGTSEWGGSSLVAVLTREFAEALPAPSEDACPAGDGDYCGGNGIEGDVDTLYTCRGGALTVKQTCAAGCYPKPTGQNDECVDRTQTCTAGDGLYCGNNGIVGDPDTLYRCANGIVTVQQHCGGACDRKPAGFDDACL